MAFADLLTRPRRRILTIVLLLPVAAFLGAWGLGTSNGEQSPPPPAQTGEATRTIAPNIVLAPHKAIYDIHLVSARSGSGIANIRGQMIYETQASCDAWISNHRFNLFYEYADSPSVAMTSDFSTYETFDGKHMQFYSRRQSNDQLLDEFRGKAALQEIADAGKASYQVPEGLSFELAPGTIFPTEHSLKLIERMRAGDKIYRVTLFDGSDDEGPFDVNAVFGAVVPAEQIKARAGGVKSSLLDSPARKVQLAFFTQKNQEISPDYEMTLALHENGVISDMFVQYDDFSVTQTLVAIEELKNSCAGDGPAGHKGAVPDPRKKVK